MWNKVFCAAVLTLFMAGSAFGQASQSGPKGGMY